MSGTDAVPEHSSEWTIVDTIAVFYVVSPFVIFMLGWVRLPLALLLVGIYGWTVASFLSRRQGRWRRGHHLQVILTVAVIAALWAGFGGAGHFFYANPFDWGPRFALAHDLTVAGWPVSYTDGATEWLLRAPLGYYLVPALLGKLLGLKWLDPLLFAWTVLGTAIFLLLIVPRTMSWRIMVACGFLIVASGADVLGFVERYWSWPEAQEHIEWWARSWQYSSNTTLLFWVPNHTLAAWVATGLLVRHAASREVVMQGIPLLLAPLALWSPLSAAGILPLTLAVLVSSRAKKADLAELGRLALICMATGLPAVLYLTYDISAIPSRDTQGGGGGEGAFLLRLGWFLLIEIGPFVLVLLTLRRDLLLVAAVTVLVLLPLFSFGGGNDLVMRTSIPALAVIWIRLLKEFVWTPLDRSRHLRAMLVLSWLVIGAVTPFQEFSRAIGKPRWAPDLESSLPMVFARIAERNPYPYHYFARLTAGGPLGNILAPCTGAIFVNQ